MDLVALAGNLARVRDDIARVQAAEGLTGDVRIVAVTKGHPSEVARAAVAVGLEDLGENRVQEAVEKLAAVPELRARWHLIGHLQTNKAKYVPGRFAMVQSIDRTRVAEALADAVARRAPGARIPVLLQVNVAGEGQKSGCAPEAAAELVGTIAGLPALVLRGLMTMAPLTDDEAVQRRVFAGLRRLRDDLQAGELDLPELSMGMSGDFRAAVAEGATMLRLGTVLFGERST